MQADVPQMQMPSTTVAKANTNTTPHSLTAMLERFVHVDTFKWTTASQVLPMNLTVNDYVANAPKHMKRYILPQSLLEASSLLRQKLNNFMLMRADVEIDVKVNANPFQQGSLLVAYSPRALSTSRFRGTGGEFLASVTSLPHQVLYLEQGNSMCFRVPYAHVLDYINLTSPDDTFGTLSIYVLTPLTGPSSAETVDVTVRLRFVDIKLEVPTDNSLLQVPAYIAMEQKALLLPRPSTTVHGLVAQMKEGETTGPVTRIASSVATIGDSLSSVPVIGTAAGMIGWFARQTAKVATVFGWSKPLDLTMPTAVVNRPAAYMGNTEGKDASLMLAQIPDNAIDPSDMIPATTDEMALGYIFDRPNIVGRILVPKSAFQQEQLLFSWEVSPFNYLTQQRDSNGQDLALGSFSFASLMYKLWRGSIQYTLSAVKTQYHAARIMAVYFPNRTRLDIPATYGELMTSNSNMIYDLTALADCEFSLSQPIVVAYTSEEPWKQTLWKNSSGLYDASTLATCVGTVGVYCINELVCPDTVAQEVTFLLQVKGGSDYEVAIPQIQLQGGFAPAATFNAAPAIAEIMNALPSMYTSAGVAVGDQPDFFQSPATGDPGDVYIVQLFSASVAEWEVMKGKTINVPDGTYTYLMDFAWNPISILTDGTYQITCVVSDGQIQTFTSDRIAATAATAGDVPFAVTVTPATGKFRAQMNEAVLDTPSDTLLVPVNSSVDLTRGTTGEYCKSLRPLTKRFIHTRNIRGPISLTPADFVNYDTDTIGDLPVGNRGWTDLAGNGALVPESWLNLVSYLYRFCAGSVRSKVFLPQGVRATTSLDITSSVATSFSTPISDPAFVVAGHINNAVEVTVPYYGQYRARTVSDQVRGMSAKQRIEFSTTNQSVPYYEAAGDDFSFWFLIGPPVMRPRDVSFVATPLVAPPS
nr:MAG: polyprotein 2 [Picornavirales sp.]